MADPSSIDLSGAVAFLPGVHQDHTRRANDGREPPQDRYSEDAITLINWVQGPADSRGDAGFKDNSRLWMHYIRPMFGYDPVACRRIREVVGRSDRAGACTVEEAYEAGERLTFQFIVRMIRAAPDPSHLDQATLARILFLVGALVHAVQDKKHLEGSSEGINSHDHTILFHWVTDICPSRGMSERSVQRTVEFLGHFEEFLDGELGPEMGRSVVGQFRGFDLQENESVEGFYSDAFMDETLPRFQPYERNWLFAVGAAGGVGWRNGDGFLLTTIDTRFRYLISGGLFPLGPGLRLSAERFSEDHSAVSFIPTVGTTLLRIPHWSLSLDGGAGVGRDFHRNGEDSWRLAWLVGARAAFLPVTGDGGLKFTVALNYGDAATTLIGLQYDTDFEVGPPPR